MSIFDRFSNAISEGSGKAVTFVAACGQRRLAEIDATAARLKHKPPAELVLPARNHFAAATLLCEANASKECRMNGVIYLVGLVVVVLAILSFFGLR